METFYWSSYPHKLPGHPPPSRLCTHHSPDWSPQCRFCRRSGILWGGIQNRGRFTLRCFPRVHMKVKWRVAEKASARSVCVCVYLCTERRCRSSLRRSSRRRSPGRTPLYNRGRSCTFRSLRESRRHHTFRSHDKVCQSPPHRLEKMKSAHTNFLNHF